MSCAIDSILAFGNGQSLYLHIRKGSSAMDTAIDSGYPTPHPYPRSRRSSTLADADLTCVLPAL